MSEIALLPAQTLTLTPFAPIAIVQPHISLLPSVTMTLVPNPPSVVVLSIWPASLQQFFLEDGNYQELPFPAVQESGTDSGVQKTRRRFTGRYTVYTGSVWLRNNTEYDTFRNFYEKDADQGNAFFNMPFPSSAAVKTVRFIPGTLIIVPDGGIGWQASFQLTQRPESL